MYPALRSSIILTIQQAFQLMFDEWISYLNENKRPNWNLPSALSLTFIHSFIQHILMGPGTVPTIPTKYNDPDTGQTMARNEDRIWSSTLSLRPFLRMPGIPHLEGTKNLDRKCQIHSSSNNRYVGLSKILIFKKITCSRMAIHQSA